MQAAEVAQILGAEPCVLFVGSGISIPAPSDLPSASAAAGAFVRRLSAGIVNPLLLDELFDVRGILPEFIYGLAERHFGDGVYDVWKCLELWRNQRDVFSANAGHLAAIHVAARWHTPVLTPNFDSYLEDAAERLGLEPRVTVAMPGTVFEPLTVGAGQVGIWKLHGTALTPATVFSSVRTLTMPVRGLREHLRAAVPPETRLVLAGYSGRDLDLFPVLAAGASRTLPVWVDLHFGVDHRSRLLNPAAAQVVASFDDVARCYSRSVNGALRAAVDSSDRLSQAAGHAASAKQLRAEIAACFDKAAAQLSDEASRRLLLGELLINGGMSKEAVKVLKGAKCNGAAESERARLLAKAEWELGRFHTSAEIATRRLRDPIAPGERDTLNFAVTAARMRAVVPPRGLPGVGSVRRTDIIKIGLSAGVSFLRAAPRALFPSHVAEPTRTPLVENWVEHGIRLLATLHLFATPANGRMPRPLAGIFAFAWRAIRAQAIRVGYAEGIGNSGRYMARLGIHDPDGILAAHEFLGHSLGVGIAHRDAAAAAIAAGDAALAIEEYMRGLEIAKLQDDPVLMLTFIPLAKKLGIELRLDPTVVAGIEAGWASNYLDWLSKENTTATAQSD
ncbi:MAG: hypothetical protein HZY73_11020 [Micropruina sp.]|nr:MAG: hypothetical protein HZY73_11020 [Micropruina sp.]